MKRLHGSANDHRTMPETDEHFSYMFPRLARRAAQQRPINATRISSMTTLGRSLATETADDPSAEGPIPAGYTYLGQFIDHDITLDATSPLTEQTDATTVRNERTPRLDLDSVFGRGPVVDPHLYERQGIGMFGRLQTRSDRLFDHPRNESDVGLIGDPRNDENLVVSQLHLAFVHFHNAAMDARASTHPNESDEDRFLTVRTDVIKHYQMLVVEDFLTRVTDLGVRCDVLMDGVQFLRQRRFAMPAEFSGAAYRFGHSMVRPRYKVNDTFPDQPFSDLFTFIRPPRLPVTAWRVDLRNFFRLSDEVEPQVARRIDAQLATDLNSLPEPARQMAELMTSLPARNLTRGAALGLPSGQDVARRIGRTPLTDDELLDGLPETARAELVANDREFVRHTPLWLYVLREAETKAGGAHLGPVGSRIVVETFIRILREDPNSYLNDEGFEPHLFSNSAEPVSAGRYSMPDLIRFAGLGVDIDLTEDERGPAPVAN